MSDDTPGVMTQPETSIHAGRASSSTNRYGDYAAMSVDPADDCTFWFTGMDNIQSVWRTQIASFRFETCGCDLKPSPAFDPDPFHPEDEHQRRRKGTGRGFAQQREEIQQQ